MDIVIAPLTPQAATLDQLSHLLIETVAHGGSVSFMHPLGYDVAHSFWSASLAAATRSERIVFGALSGSEVVGTVTLHLDCPQNQPHRAEIAKMMTRVQWRGKGVGTRLLQAAEDAACAANRSLLVLDTAAEDGAAQFYEKLGFIRAGEIPDYALKPHGGLTGTILYFKRLPRTAAI
jgi:ribosomal protein S18 acetylase RimI-like enzyme